MQRKFSLEICVKNSGNCGKMIIYKTGIFTHSPEKNFLLFHCKYLVSLIVEANSLEIA